MLHRKKKNKKCTGVAHTSSTGSALLHGRGTKYELPREHASNNTMQSKQNLNHSRSHPLTRTHPLTRSDTTCITKWNFGLCTLSRTSMRYRYSARTHMADVMAIHFSSSRSSCIARIGKRPALHECSQQASVTTQNLKLRCSTVTVLSGDFSKTL